MIRLENISNTYISFYKIIVFHFHWVLQSWRTFSYSSLMKVRLIKGLPFTSICWIRSILARLSQEARLTKHQLRVIKEPHFNLPSTFCSYFHGKCDSEGLTPEWNATWWNAGFFEITISFQFAEYVFTSTVRVIPRALAKRQKSPNLMKR